MLAVAHQYDHDLKFKVRNEADGVSEVDLAKIWAQDGVALFNIFNAIKFNKDIFDATPFGGRKGCAYRWLQSGSLSHRYQKTLID